MVTKQTGSETSAADPAVDSRDSAGPSEFPPPSPKAHLHIVMRSDQAKCFRWIRWKQALRAFRKDQA